MAFIASPAARTGLHTLLAAACAALAFAATPAMADTTWRAPDGRLTLTHPDGWPVDVMSAPNARVYEVAAGTAARECRVYLVPNDATSAASAQDVRRAFATPIDTDRWAASVRGFPFLEGDVTVESTSVDETGFWPRQLAQIRSQGRAVYAAIQGRPGADIFTFCTTFDGPDAPQLYSAVIASVGTGADAELQAAAEAAAAARAAAPAAPPTAEAAPQTEEGVRSSRRRN